MYNRQVFTIIDHKLSKKPVYSKCRLGLLTSVVNVFYLADDWSVAREPK